MGVTHMYKSKFGIGDKVHIMGCQSIVVHVQRVSFTSNGNTVEVMWMDSGCHREAVFYGWQ